MADNLFVSESFCGRPFWVAVLGSQAALHAP